MKLVSLLLKLLNAKLLKKQVLKQDVRWPLEGKTYEDSKRLVAEGKLSAEELVRYFCKMPSENQSKLELSGIKHASNEQL